tara:strand:- start:2936 stop:3562 length:627 start_codon:yes stop_codon:yes gene_type:complete
MKPFTIETNQYLTQNTQGFYHTDFGGVNLPNNPNYLYKLKNDPHHNWSDYRLQEAQQEFLRVLLLDLPEVTRQINKNPLMICVVPRAKAENSYNPNQLLFKATVRIALNRLGDSFTDGTNLIERHTNTMTTHIRQAMEGYINDGPYPYVGITNATCNISNNVVGKDILLIDDIYTKTVNIDEDAIQALISKGANSVTFYAIGKTVFNH